MLIIEEVVNYKYINENHLVPLFVSHIGCRFSMENNCIFMVCCFQPYH